MRLFKENLLVQFSAVSLVVMTLIGVIIAVVLTQRLAVHIDLMDAILSPQNQFLNNDIDSIRWITMGLVVGGFVLIYAALLYIVWRGWKTILQQREQLESVSYGLEDQLQSSIREMAVVDEVARIITATLEIDEVYEKFAQEVNKLVDFDRIAINTFDPFANTLTFRYISGVSPVGREMGTTRVVGGTRARQALETGRTVIAENISDGQQFYSDPQYENLGMRASIMVPLISKGQSIGVLSLRSRKPNAYTEREQSVLERLARQIAPAVENAQLYDQAKSEMAAVDEVAKAINSTLDINQVYDTFSQELLRLVNFDRLTINLVDQEAGTYTVAHVMGQDIPERQAGDVLPLSDSSVEETVRSGQTWIENNLPQYPESTSGVRARIAGMHSVMRVPLVSNRRAIGTTGLFSLQSGAFGPREQAILERLSNHIATAIENASLYQDLQTSTAEMAVVDEVATIITSTLDIDEVFERFAEEVRKLVDFERMDICAFNPESGACIITHEIGRAVPGFGIGNAMPLSDRGVDALAREVLTGHRPFLIVEDFAVEKNGSTTQSFLDSGLRSGMLLPMISNGEAFGVLSLLSQRTGAYGPREQAIMERLAMQIAPAFENAGIYEQVRAEMELVDDVARVITSTLNLEEVYEKFAGEVKRLVDFDHMGINLFDRDARVMYQNTIDGQDLELVSRGPVTLEGTQAEAVLGSGQTLVRSDIRTDLQFRSDLLNLERGLVSSIAVPLMSEGQVFGILALRSRQVNAFGPLQQTILERLASQIAPAIANARLHQELQASAEEITVVDEVARIITSSLDISEVYERFA
ncbi:MAG: GAF domain-containing protein, partial [Dehalococcoidia bacterium]